MFVPSGRVVLPLAVWGPEPPDHPIHSLLLSNTGQKLVTGSQDGSIILWKREKSFNFNPEWMILGHRGCILNLCLADSDENTFFSHSHLGELAIWNWRDGTCIEFKLETRYPHVNIKSHQPSFLDHRLLFCCGRYPHIVILHAVSLTFLFHLTSQAQPDWISDFVVFSHPNKQHEVVLGVSFSHAATLWTLNGKEAQGETKHEHEARTLDCSSTILQVDCCTQFPRCVLLVTHSELKLLDAMACSIFHSHPSPDKDPLVGGQFVDRNSILVYCQSGAALVYRFHIRTLSGTTSRLSCEYFVLVQRLLPPSANFPGPQSDICHSFFRSENSGHQFLYGGTTYGQLLRWQLNSEAFGASVLTQLREGSVPASTLHPSTVGDLASTWSRYPPEHLLSFPVDKQEGLTSPVSSKTPIVITCVQISQMVSNRQGCPKYLSAKRLALGFSDGRITIVRLVDLLRTTFWASDFRSPASQINSESLLRHSRFHLLGHVGPVTSLLHPASADDYVVETCVDKTKPFPVESSNCQFNPDHLVSGGADFTVRLWDLDPWRGGLGSVHRTNSISGTPNLDPVCLAVFRCHASPCIALAVGPPTFAVMNRCAGNSRLCCCVCSVGSDGSVSVINLCEHRQLLSTASVSTLSNSPVLAIGWRVPEDLLLVTHLDGTLEIWDVMMGALERLEQDQPARELLESAHFLVEVQNIPTAFGFAASVLTNASTPKQQTSLVSIPSMCMSANHFSSSAAVKFSAPWRWHCSPTAASNRTTSHRLQQLSVVHLQTVGSTRSGSDDVLTRGPVAVVFHWDIEAVVVDLLAENEKESADDSLDISIAHTASNAQFELIQILLSTIHPWGVDSDGDDALRACLGFPKPSTKSCPRLANTLCLCIPSKHGCLSISMPGCSSVPQQDSKRSNVAHCKLHAISAFASTSMLLAELSLAETLTSLNSDYLLRLCESILRTSDFKSESIGDPQQNIRIRSNWLRLGARLIGPISRALQDAASSGQTPYLELLIRKWQDRTLPIRYASRTLLLAFLDHMGETGRQNLVIHWSLHLPSSHDTRRRFSAIPTGTNEKTVPTFNDKMSSKSPTRQQSLPPDSTMTLVNGGPRWEQADSVQESSPTSRLTSHSTAKPSAMSSSNGSQCIDGSSSHGDELRIGDGYHPSTRDHHRLQALATVLLGVIGARYGPGVQQRHPAISSRDLISDADPIYVRGSATRMNGLASPCFFSADFKEEIRLPSSSQPTIDQFCTGESYLSRNAPEGFGVDNYQLSRSLSQCLTALLFNRVTPPLPSVATNGASIASNDVASHSLSTMLSSSFHTTLRRAAIDILGRGFVVWEPYVDLNQIVNTLLLLTVKTEELLSSIPKWQSLPDRIDFARTAREALWEITFARPKAVTLVLSLEVRRYGAQINAAATAAATNTGSTASKVVSLPGSTPPIVPGFGNTSVLPKDGSSIILQSVVQRESADEGTPVTSNTAPNMMVMMASPAVAAPIFGPPTPLSSSDSGGHVVHHAGSLAPGSLPPMFSAREEIIRLFEQLCVRRAADVVPVLPELVEVVLACLDRTRLKERGLEFVFPALRQFSAFSANTRSQKVCVGGVNGSITFFDFKLGRYFVTTGHKGPVTAVRFQSEGRLVATYSLTESVLRIWQLQTAGFFGMGGQQVKSLSVHPVPPLLPPPPKQSHQPSTETKNSTTSPDLVCCDPISVWLDWPESRVVQLITDGGVKRRVNL